jgi:hypothetical protein
MNRGAHIVAKAGERQLGGARAAADRLLCFKNENGPAGLRERDGSREAVRPRADDNRV